MFKHEYAIKQIEAFSESCSESISKFKQTLWKFWGNNYGHN